MILGAGLRLPNETSDDFLRRTFPLHWFKPCGVCRARSRALIASCIVYFRSGATLLEILPDAVHVLAARRRLHPGVPWIALEAGKVHELIRTPARHPVALDAAARAGQCSFAVLDALGWRLNQGEIVVVDAPQFDALLAADDTYKS